MKVPRFNPFTALAPLAGDRVSEAGKSYFARLVGEQRRLKGEEKKIGLERQESGSQYGGRGRSLTRSDSVMSDDVGSVSERSAGSPKSGKPAEKEKVKVLYVNNINAQRWHDCFRVLLGVDDDEVFRDDVYQPGIKHVRVSLPEVSLEGLLSAATSFDAQYVHLYDYHLLFRRLQLNQLTHLNLQHNCLGDPGLVRLARGLAKAGAGIQHLNVAENLISCQGISSAVEALLALPRLSSLDL